MSRRSKQVPRHLDVHAVLDGRVRPRPTADELATLICDVNPTDRGLDPSSIRRRYALKARLQSLLLREHFDSVNVSVDEHDVAALSLVVSGRGAAHVPLDELDVDVRAQVRRALDENRGGLGANVEAPKDAGSASADAPVVVRVRGELMHGDLAVAREMIVRALSDVSSPSRAALLSQFLAMLVDGYADELAIEIVSTVGATDHTGLTAHARGALGLAYARMGDRQRARAMLTELHGSRASDAWAQLGLLAIADGAHPSVGEARDAIAAMDATHPVLEQLDAHLTKIAREAAERAESLFTAALARATTDDQRAAIASEHLARGGGGRLARRTLDEIESRRRAHERVDLLRRARDEPDASRRRDLLRAAQDRGAAGIDEEIKAAELAAAADRAASEVRDLERRVEEGGIAALKAWLHAPKRTRQRAALPPELALAGRLAVDLGRGAGARACLAVANATSAFESGDLRASESALAAGGSDALVLAMKVGLKHKLDEAHRRAVADEERNVLDNAERAIAASNTSEARKLLAKLDGARADDLRARLVAMEEATRLLAEEQGRGEHRVNDRRGKRVRGEWADYFSRFKGEAILPNMEALAEVFLEGAIAVLVHEPDAIARQMALEMGWDPSRGAVFRLTTAARTRLATVDHVTGRWLSRRDGAHRVFAIVQSGTLLLNYEQGVGWSTEPGSTDSELLN